jgi:hypothetical protein
MTAKRTTLANAGRALAQAASELDSAYAILHALGEEKMARAVEVMHRRLDYAAKALAHGGPTAREEATDGLLAWRSE